jgi:hypothetical protein
MSPFELIMWENLQTYLFEAFLKELNLRNRNFGSLLGDALLRVWLLALSLWASKSSRRNCEVASRIYFLSLHLRASSLRYSLAVFDRVAGYNMAAVLNSLFWLATSCASACAYILTSENRSRLEPDAIFQNALEVASSTSCCLCGAS